jgi:hypothetical protein
MIPTLQQASTSRSMWMWVRAVSINFVIKKMSMLKVIS